MSAIEATSVRAFTMADGSLRITVDIEPRHSQAAFALFCAPGTPLAIAALQCAKAEPAEPAPKGGELARWAAMRCQEASFQRWAQERFTREWGDAPGDTPTAWAASVVRAVCGIESRAELDNDPEAAKRFHALIREPYSREQA